MIWESLSLMTVFDVVIVVIAFASIRAVYRQRQVIAESRRLIGAWTLVAGLAGIGLFYLADLYTMWILPLYVPEMRAMAAMEDLHLNYSWWVMLAVTLSIFVGFGSLLQGMFEQASKLREEVTSRERADVAMMESEETTRTLLNATHESAFLVDPIKGTILALNETAARSFGMSIDEIVGLQLRDLVPSDVAESRLAKGAEVIRTGKPVHFQDERHGMQFDITLYPVFDAGGEVAQLAVFAQDITERKVAQTVRHRFEHIVSSSSDMLALIDTDFTYLAVNEAYRQPFGMKETDLIGHTVSEVFGKEFFETTILPHAERCVAGEESHYQEWFEFPVSERRYMDVSYYPYVDAGGEIQGFAVSTRDITEHKQAEEAIRETEAEFRAVLENSRDLLYKFNIQTGKYDYMSPSIESMTGVNVEEYMEGGLKFAVSLLHPDDRERLEAHVEHLLKKGLEDDFEPTIEYRFKHPTDGYRWYSDNRSVLYGEDGSPIAIVGSSRDITESKRAGEALSASESKFRTYIESAPSGIFIVDGGGNYVDVNDAAVQMTGYSRAELLALNFSDITGPDDRARAQSHFADLVRTGASQCDLSYVAKDGRVRYWTVSAVRLPNDRYVAFKTDITERQRWEQALQRLVESSSSHFGESFFHSMSLDIANILGADYALIGEIQDTEPASIRTLAAVVDGEIVPNLEYGLADTPCENVVGQTLCVYESSVADQFPKDVLLKDMGAVGYMGVPLTSSTGKPLGLIVVLTRSPLTNIDFTKSILHICSARVVSEIERMKTENALHESEEKYRQAQKMESIGRLAGGISHDLNNLLSPILGYSEIMSGETDPESKHFEYLAEIAKAGTGARDLVAQLLAFSRKQALQLKFFDLNEVAQDFQGLLKRTIPEDIKLDLVLCDRPLPIKADPRQIEQVIMNLVVNAADAMPNGGTLTIETSREVTDTPTSAYTSEVPAGDYVVLSVTDSGSGIDEQSLEQLFEPFYSTKGQQGTGLGLATVYGIVRQHNSYIDVRTVVGSGTTFRVICPVSAETEQPKEPMSKVPQFLDGTGTILVVEDYQPLRQLADTVLSRQGYSVVLAEDGPTALQALEAHGSNIDLLLTDVVMPHMSGKELFDVAKAKHPNLKVIYMSGYSENHLSHRGVLYEQTDFIRKPFTIDGLASKVREVLSN